MSRYRHRVSAWYCLCILVLLLAKVIRVQQHPIPLYGSVTSTGIALYSATNHCNQIPPATISIVSKWYHSQWAAPGWWAPPPSESGENNRGSYPVHRRSSTSSQYRGSEGRNSHTDTALPKLHDFVKKHISSLLPDISDIFGRELQQWHLG